MKRLMMLATAMLCAIVLTGCATEYYEPKDGNFVKTEDKIYGPVKREGFLPWSNGVGKNLPLANPSFSVISD